MSAKHAKKELKEICFIVAFDGSEQSVNAIEETFLLTSGFDHKHYQCVIISVTMRCTVSSASIGGVEIVNQAVEASKQTQQEAIKLLKTMASQALDVHPKRQLLAKSMVIDCVNPAQEFVSYLEKRKKAQKSLDYVVCGSRGLGGIRRTLLGSFSDHVVRHLNLENVELLITKQRDIKPLMTTNRFTFLLAIDGSDESERALQHLCELVTKRRNNVDRIEALLVIDSFLVPTADVLDCDVGGSQEQMAAKIYTEKLSERLKALSIQHQVTLLDTSADVPNKIVQHLKTVKATHVVMGTSGKGIFHRLLVGSSSDQVVQTSPCAVFLSK